MFASDIIRKNNYESGVDLNRNYGFKFGFDSKGSSDDPCDETYRGSQAFSEKETQAIRNLILKNRKTSSAINLHAYGNLWINPFCYTSDLNDKTFFDSNVYDFYAAFHKKLEAEGITTYGNAIKAINYTANGEASDWMLGEHGIISMSPELGERNSDTNAFYLSKEQVQSLTKKDYNVIQNWFEMSMPTFSKIKLNLIESAPSITNIQKSNQFKLTISFKNEGIADLRSLSFYLSFFSKNDASQVNSMEFNDNLNNKKIKLEKDKTEIKLKAVGKFLINKLSENKVTIVFKDKLEKGFVLHFFKINKEIAKIKVTDQIVVSLFIQNLFSSVLFKLLSFLVFVGIAYIIYQFLTISNLN